MYGFCSNDALYSLCVSFRVFIFLLTPFDTWDCYYLGSYLSLVLLMKVLLIKNTCNLFFSLLKKKKQLCHMSTFLRLSSISLGWYWKRSAIKSGRFGKKIKRWNGHIRRLSIEGVVQTFYTLCPIFFSNWKKYTKPSWDLIHNSLNSNTKKKWVNRR